MLSLPSNCCPSSFMLQSSLIPYDSVSVDAPMVTTWMGMFGTTALVCCSLLPHLVREIFLLSCIYRPHFIMKISQAVARARGTGVHRNNQLLPVTFTLGGLHIRYAPTVVSSVCGLLIVVLKSCLVVVDTWTLHSRGGSESQ